MNRRGFIAGLGSAAAWPWLARAQQIERQDKARRIGVLLGAVEERDPEAQARIAAFREGLKHSAGLKTTTFMSTTALAGVTPSAFGLT